MATLSELAEDVPPRVQDSVLIGGATAYQTQKLLPTAFAGTDGVPRDDTVMVAQSGNAVDKTYAELRGLLELYRCNTGVTPIAGQALGVNTSGLVEAVEALLSVLSANKYDAGRLLRSNGTAYVDEAVGVVYTTSGAPSGALGVDGDIAVDYAASTLYHKGGAGVPGVWDTITIGSGGVAPVTVIADHNTLALTSATVTTVQWDSAGQDNTGTAWTYDGTDHYWSPPTAGTYEIEAHCCLFKSTTGGGDFRVVGQFDLTGGGSWVSWPGAFESDGRVGDDTDSNYSEGNATVSSFLQSLTTSSRIRVVVIAQTANQSIKGSTGYFKAKRIA